MNRLEFETTIKALGINEILSKTTRGGILEKVYKWHDFIIYFSGTTIIRGKIPFEVAETIYEKYPNNIHGIRVAGGNSDWNPKNFVHGNYLSTYHIDTKEGLVIFILEMMDFYNRKHNEFGMETKRYDKIMERITNDLLNNINPYISNNNWMMADKTNYQDYFDSLLKEKNTFAGEYLRMLLNQYDKTINPFLNYDITLDNMENYIQKVTISGKGFDSLNGIERNNCAELYITDLNNQNKASYLREPTGLNYILNYKLDTNNHLYTNHTYSNKSSNPNNQGELFWIDCYGDNPREEIVYNLTKGLIGTYYGEKRLITMNDIAYLCHELEKIIEYASSVTINNMIKQERKIKKH